jgi:TPR repeat protein
LFCNVTADRGDNVVAALPWISTDPELWREEPPMDRWRDRLQQLNERQDKKAADRRFALVSLGLLAVIGGVGFATYEPPSTLEGGVASMNPDTTEGAAAEQSPQDGFALFQQGDYAAAIAKLRPLAEQDDVSAQCRLGIALMRTADAAERDRRVEAVKWLDQCLRRYDHPNEADNDTAHRLIDEIIKTAGWDIVGEGRYLSFQFQQANLNAELGRPNGAPDSVTANLHNLDGDAAFALGVDLYNGNDMPIDYEKGVRAFHRAVEFGIPEAAFNLGVAYYSGKGVKADPVEALRWFKIGADGSFAKAATMAGVMLARGHGSARNVDEAVDYLRLAEKLGDDEAAFMADAVADGAIPY